MYAAIMSSSTPLGIRYTAVIPMMDKSVRVFTRVGAVRGIAGAWKEEAPTFLPMETVVGQSHSVLITANDYRDLQFPITPTTLLQKLSRTTDVAPTTTLAQDEYNTLIDLAYNNPFGIAGYLKGISQAPAPIMVSVHRGNTVTQEELIPAVPITEEVISNYEVVEESLPEEVPIYHTESKPTMNMNFQSTIINSERDAVLVVPEVQPYFSRTIDGVSEETVYDYARRTQQAVLITGDAGTGKTSSARHYAATHKLPFVTIECTQQIDQSTTQGRFVPTGVGNSVEWKNSQLATAIQQPSVVLINELTRMTPKAASLFLRLLQERELVIEPLNQVIKVHPECLFVADQNTGIGYTGTSKQDNALVDRFNIKMEFHYDTEIEAKFIKSPALLEFAKSIRIAAETNDEFSVPLSTRALMNFQAQSQNLGFIFAVNALMNNYPKSDGEREAIKMRFDADAMTIASELGVDYANYSA